MYIVQLLDWYSASISVIFICTIEILIVGWIYGVENFKRDIEFMLKEKVGTIWIIFWKYITPLILICIFFTTIIYNTNITYNGRLYPQWSIYVGWGTCLLSMICVPICMIYQLSKEKGNYWDRIRKSLKPSDWGPAKEEHRRAWNES